MAYQLTLARSNFVKRGNLSGDSFSILVLFDLVHGVTFDAFRFLEFIEGGSMYAVAMLCAVYKTNFMCHTFYAYKIEYVHPARGNIHEPSSLLLFVQSRIQTRT